MGMLLDEPPNEVVHGGFQRVLVIVRPIVGYRLEDALMKSADGTNKKNYAVCLEWKLSTNNYWFT